MLKIKSVSKNLLMYMILLSYLKPYNVVLLPTIDMIYKITKVCATACLLLAFFRRKQKVSLFSLLGGLFCGIWSVSMYLNNGGLGEHLQEILSIIGICLLFDYYSEKEGFKTQIFSAISNIAKVYILLNTITVLTQKPLFAEAEIAYINFFLGSDNYWAFILLPLSGIIAAGDMLLNGKIRKQSWFFMLLGLFDLVYQIAYTGILAYCIMLILLLSTKWFRPVKKIRLNWLLAVIFAFVLCVSYCDLQSLLMPVFKMLGKSVGFNSRQYIWPLAINAILNKPILGYGYITEELHHSAFLYGAGHPHNIILELLLDTGFLGTAVFLLWMNHALAIGRKVREQKYIRILVCCFTSIVICGVFDFYIGLIYFYLLAALINYCRRTERKVNEG